MDGQRSGVSAVTGAGHERTGTRGHGLGRRRSTQAERHGLLTANSVTDELGGICRGLFAQVRHLTVAVMRPRNPENHAAHAAGRVKRAPEPTLAEGRGASGGTMVGRGPSKGGAREACCDRSGSTGPDRHHRPDRSGGVRQRHGRRRRAPGLGAGQRELIQGAGGRRGNADGRRWEAGRSRNAGRRVALRGRSKRGPGRGQPDRFAAPGHAQGRDPGSDHARRALRAPAYAGRTALRSRVRRLGPAGVCGGNAKLPAGHRAAPPW